MPQRQVPISMQAAPEIQEPISKLTVMTAGEGFIRVGELCNLQYFTFLSVVPLSITLFKAIPFQIATAATTS